MQLSQKRTGLLDYRFSIIRLFYLSVFFSLGITSDTLAQAQLGFHLQQSAGINATVLNPARTATYPYRWDVNVVGINVFGANDYSYLEQTNLFRMLQNFPQNTNVYGRVDIGEGVKLPADSYVADFFDLGRKGYAVSSMDIMGPSISYKINEMHSIGFMSRARTWAGTQNIPSGLSYYNFYNKPFFEEIPLDPFVLNAMAWTEIGLNYSLNVPVTNGLVSLGVTVKKLDAYEGVYFQSEKSFNLIKLPNDSIGGTDFILSGALTTANLKGGDYEVQSQGGGVGIDLGITYSIDDGDGGYIWQFGFSLLDVGRVSFSKSAEKHRVVGTQFTSLGADDYSDISGLEDVTGKIQLFSMQALQNPNASLEGNSFSLWLPTALSLQIDHHFGNGWYTSAVLLQGMPLNKQSPNRGSLLAAVPRFEKKWYAASLPLSVYNWNLIRVGFAARLGFLTLGTDDLGSWLIRKNISSGDVYLAVKMPLFKSSSDSGGVKSGKRRKGGGLGCYKF